MTTKEQAAGLKQLAKNPLAAVLCMMLMGGGSFFGFSLSKDTATTEDIEKLEEKIDKRISAIESHLVKIDEKMFDIIIEVRSAGSGSAKRIVLNSKEIDQ